MLLAYEMQQFSDSLGLIQQTWKIFSLIHSQLHRAMREGISRSRFRGLDGK